MLGHRRDPVHPFTDAGMLAEEMPNARLLQANSLMELRMRPERLTDEIADFLDEVWESSRSRQAPRETPGETGAGERQADARTGASRRRPGSRGRVRVR